MIPGGRAESTRSCCQLFTGSSPVVGKTASGRFLCEPDRKGNSRSLAAIQPPSFDFNAGFSRIARGFHACKGNSVGHVPGISRIHCLARVLLACYLNPGAILSSADGVFWERENSSTTNELNTVMFVNGLFVAGGGLGTILTSTDGVTWTNRSSTTKSNLYEIAFGNGKFVAVGYGGVLLTSPDAIDWTTANSGTLFSLRGVAYGNGTFVAVASGDNIMTSTVGVNWVRRSSGTQQIYPDGPTGLVLRTLRPQQHFWIQ